MPLSIPRGLAASCSRDPVRAEWLRKLPDTVNELAFRWDLTLRSPFNEEEDFAAGWVAPVARSNGSDAVLKVAMPHMEGADEIAGLRYWDGVDTVQLLDAEDSAGAMLLERCVPGISLRDLPEPEQDIIRGELLPRIWELRPGVNEFRPLSAMLCWRPSWGCARCARNGPAAEPC